MESPNKPNSAIISIVVIVLLAIATAGVSAITNTAGTSPTSSKTTTQTTSAPATNPTAASPTAAGTYKDGTYNATGSYLTPGGDEAVAVTVTLAGNAITDVSISQNSNSDQSARYQSAFESSYKSYVVGKDINSVSLSRVSGASLTSSGFNDALDIIKNDARA